MMLTKGRRKFIATVCERLATVAFAGVFASEFFAKLPIAPRVVVIVGIIVLVLVGFIASPSDGGGA